jgi:hypothetical protein
VSTDNEFQTKLNRLEALVQQADRLPDPAARECARELVRALLDLHADGLERLLDHVDAVTDGAVLDACAADDVVGGLLLLHGLHPLPVEDRVQRALEQARPVLRSLGAEVELIGVDDGVLRLRFEANGDGRVSSAAVWRAVEEAITTNAPDLTGVEIEGLEVAPVDDGRVALPLL